MTVELLAPAKDKLTAFSAIDCGADAVYIGACSFGARKKAGNNIDDIKEVVNYAHKYWAKVFVTMNTILTDSELDNAVELAVELNNIGVDALIIQDLGLLERLIEINFPLPIHMSTQCDNYLPEKVKFFNELGVSRVVLARELSIEKIKEIHKENPNLELEGFVHGALCVSMSGKCYLSHYIGGRSANRGECAQPCRKKYTVETIDGKVIKKDFYALCLKDFNASYCLKELKDSGIYSFKIEGRLKDIGYVKNITAYYRQILGKGVSSGKSFYPFMPNPEKSFNRGFTEYFLKSRGECYNQESSKSRGEYLGKIIEVNSNWFKIKTDKEIHPQDGIYFKGDGFAVNKVSQPSFQLGENIYTIYPNKKVDVKKGDKLWRNLDFEFEKELLKPVKRQIGVSLEFSKNTILLTDEDGVTVTQVINQAEKANNPEKMKENFIRQFSKTGESDFYIIETTVKTELPFMPVGEINKLRRELFEKLMQKRLEVYNENKEIQKPLKYSKYYTDTVDYHANVHNKKAVKFYNKCGVKVLEQSFEQKKPNKEIELMHCKHCIKYALNMCKSPEKLLLKDESGKTYRLRFDCKNCEMFILTN